MQWPWCGSRVSGIRVVLLRQARQGASCVYLCQGFASDEAHRLPDATAGDSTLQAATLSARSLPAAQGVCLLLQAGHQVTYEGFHGQHMLQAAWPPMHRPHPWAGWPAQVVCQLLQAGYQVTYERFQGQHVLPPAVAASMVSWFLGGSVSNSSASPLCPGST